MEADPDRDLALLYGLLFAHPRMHFARREHRCVRVLERAQRAVADCFDDASAVLDDDRLEDVQVIVNFAERSGVTERLIETHAVADVDEQDR